MRSVRQARIFGDGDRQRIVQSAALNPGIHRLVRTNVKIGHLGRDVRHDIIELEADRDHDALCFAAASRFWRWVVGSVLSKTLAAAPS
jgi:hypothetical protein